MFTSLQSMSLAHTGMGSHAEARKASTKLFENALSQARSSRILVKIFGKSNALRTLTSQPVQTARTSRIVVVPLDRIVGSEGRCADFDASFRPLKAHNRERWINIAVARREGVPLPAVELVQIGDEYYVRDGHHRISVAHVIGQVEIDARIVN